MVVVLTSKVRINVFRKVCLLLRTFKICSNFCIKKFKRLWDDYCDFFKIAHFFFLEFRTMWRPEMVFWDTFIRVFGLWPFFILIKNLTFTEEDTHTGTKMMWNWFKLWNSKEKYFFRIAKQFSKLNKQTFRFSKFCAEKQNNRVSFKLDISIYGTIE